MVTVTIYASKGGVGKTNLAANLARLLAASGYRILLISAGLEPALSNFYIFELKAYCGVPSVLCAAIARRAGDLLISPIHPDIVCAREFHRGMLAILKVMAPRPE